MFDSHLFLRWHRLKEDPSKNWRDTKDLEQFRLLPKGEQVRIISTPILPFFYNLTLSGYVYVGNGYNIALLVVNSNTQFLKHVDKKNNIYVN